LKRTGLGLIAALGLFVLPASAGKVTYQCDPNSIDPGLCQALNNTLGSEYAALFENANANIYIQKGSLPDSQVAHNDQFYTTISYSSYYNALKASISGPADAVAVASLPVGAPFGNPINPGYQVALTSALDAALGFTGANGCKLGAVKCGGGCTLSSATASTCFDGIITISDSSLKHFYLGDSEDPPADQYDFFTVVQHETDEILGTGSCIGGGTLLISPACLNGAVWGTSAADLFRYIGPGLRGFSIGPSQSVLLPLGQQAYFSIDGGQTSIASLYNSKDGPDYGDLSTVCQHVQDSIGCRHWPAGNNRVGMDLTNDGGVEIAMLDAMGYQLTSQGKDLSAASVAYTPEPSSIDLVSIGFGASAVLWRRRQRGLTERA
jgi:hypothetical protein